MHTSSVHLLDLPASLVASRILAFLTFREKLREVIPLCRSFDSLLIAGSFAHDQLSLRIGALPRDWSEHPIVRRLVSGVASVWAEDDATFQLLPAAVALNSTRQQE